MADGEFLYDVFISYSHKDLEWVRDNLVRRLRDQDARVCVDYDCLELGEPNVVEIERAVQASRWTIVVITPEYLRSEWASFEFVLTRTLEAAEISSRLVPILLKPCEKLPRRFSTINYADFTSGEEEFQMTRVIAKVLHRPHPEFQATAVTRLPRRRQRSARRGSRHILVLCPLFGASRIYYSELLDAILNRARRSNYDLVIEPVSPRDKKPLRELLAFFQDIEGIIAITCQVEDSDWLDECNKLEIPLVLIHDNIAESRLRGTTAVSFIRPQLDGLRELVRHITGVHNARNIAVVIVHERGHLIRQQKLDAIRETLRDDHIPFREDQQLFRISEYTHSAGQRVVEDILTVNPEVDAILSLADVTAIGIMQELRERGLGHVRVTGFDNIEITQHFDLTSVDQQLRATGERALADLDSAVRNRVFHLSGTTYIPTTPIFRSSCCLQNDPQLPTNVEIHRLALYYIVRHPGVSRFVESVRSTLYRMTLDERDTVSLLGKAPLFPLHITVRGIFHLSDKRSLEHFRTELEAVLASQPQITIRTAGIINYPSDTMSLGLDSGSVSGMRTLQAAVLPVIEKYRDREIVEPEFRAFAASPDALVQEYTTKYGEPYVLDQFNPHISIISGLEGISDFEQISRLVDSSGVEGLELQVDALELVYEVTLGGSWQTYDVFNLE